jgi:hypothetical protein
MAAGIAPTATLSVAIQPFNVYEIVAEPAATPRTMPVAAPTVALAVEELAHVPEPPPDVSASVVLFPIHTDGVPVIATGNAFTVTVTGAG